MRAALLCLALMLPNAWALNPPTPSTGKSIDQQEAHSAQTKQTTPEIQRGSASHPVFVQSVPGVESPDETNHRKYEHHEKPTLERLMGWGTFWLAVFTLLLVISTAVLATFTFFLWQDSMKAFASANRPKIKVRHIWPTGELWSDEKLNVMIQVVNIGLHPAKIIELSMRTEIFMVDRPLPSPPKYEVAFKSTVEIFLNNGDSANLPCQERTISPDDNDSLRNRRTRLCCFGYITYTDKLGVQTTAFCRELQPLPSNLTGAFSSIGRFVRLDPEDEDYEYQD